MKDFIDAGCPPRPWCAAVGPIALEVAENPGELGAGRHYSQRRATSMSPFDDYGRPHPPCRCSAHVNAWR